MTTTSCTEERSAAAASSAAPVRWMAGCARALIAFWRRREAVRALQQMDDRGLRDIGLTRSHIEDAVRGNAQIEQGWFR
jgi:uncharacterized protein YjiS (DUF1127 family)